MMKLFLIVAAIVLVIPVLLLFGLGLMSKKGNAPGLIQGKLARCPNTPNCFCSEYPHDVDHYTEPLRLHENNALAGLNIIREIIAEQGGTIRSEHENYLSATFSSAFFGFVDDFEIRLDPAQNVIHIRSAARVGQSDFGVNRKRVKSISNYFNSRYKEK